MIIIIIIIDRCRKGNLQAYDDIGSQKNKELL